MKLIHFLYLSCGLFFSLSASNLQYPSSSDNTSSASSDYVWLDLNAKVYDLPFERYDEQFFILMTLSIFDENKKPVYSEVLSNSSKYESVGTIIRVKPNWYVTVSNPKYVRIDYLPNGGSMMVFDSNVSGLGTGVISQSSNMIEFVIGGYNPTINISIRYR